MRMGKYEVYFNSVIAFVCSVFTWLFGTWDTAIGVLILFMALDYFTGLVRAFIRKELSSDIGFRGLTRKMSILVVLIVAVNLDRLMNTGTWVFRTLVCYFYISNEGISLIENCASLGVPIPGKLLDALVQLKDGEKKGEPENVEEENCEAD